jgi:plastocyanin
MRAVLVALPLLGLVTPAEAAPMQVVAYSGGFVPSEVYVVRGDTLTLTNVDTVTHDLVSRQRRSNGTRLFASSNVGPAGQGEVYGVSALPASTYPFVCSIHSYMVGNLTVLAAPVR